MTRKQIFLHTLMLRLIITLSVAGWLYSLMTLFYRIENERYNAHGRMYGIEFYDGCNYLFIYTAIAIFIIGLWFISNNKLSFISCELIALTALIYHISILFLIDFNFSGLQPAFYISCGILVAIVILLIIKFVFTMILDKCKE